MRASYPELRSLHLVFDPLSEFERGARIMSGAIVIGLGNEFRGDDGVGLIAARQLRERGLAAVDHEGDLAALIDRWKGAARVILIDAVASGAAPGTVHQFDASASPLPRE